MKSIDILHVITLKEPAYVKVLVHNFAASDESTVEIDVPVP